jgi:putative transposase
LIEKRIVSSRAELAHILGVSRASLYYVPRSDARDWKLKTEIEAMLRGHPSYGSRRIALALRLNRKRIQRVMRRFGIMPYRRRGRKWRHIKRVAVVYPNLLLGVMPAYPHHVWAADFTELVWRGRKVYVATVIDLYTRTVVGVAVSLRRGTPLTLQALWSGLAAYPHPAIFHSDNGKEYIAGAFVAVLAGFGITISRTHPGCPWENGYQESFYDKFKVDLGDPGRFRSLGELVAEIYATLWAYNHTRIHSALKMPPKVFAERF